MQIPVFRSNGFVKICHRISSQFDEIWYKFIIKPIIFILPISFFLAIISDIEIFKSAIKIFPEQIQDELLKSHLILVASIFFIIQTGKGIEELIRHWGKPNSELNRDDLHSILTCINEVVCGKMRRFLSTTKVALREKWEHDRIFNEITQPSQQIALQVKAIHGFFEYLTNNNIQFRVGLMRVVNGKLVDWSSFFPDEHPPKASIEALSSPTSTIMRALERRETIIVSDTKAELSKKSKEQRCFVGAGASADGNSSILTHPIYCPNTKEPIYVLSILAKEKNVLEEKHKLLYEWIIENFLSRILIEHHLLILKEGVKS